MQSDVLNLQTPLRVLVQDDQLRHLPMPRYSITFQSCVVVTNQSTRIHETMKLDLAIIYTVVSTSWVNIESILAETRSPDRTSSSIYCVIGNLRRGVIPVGNLNKIFGDYIASVRIETGS